MQLVETLSPPAGWWQLGRSKSRRCGGLPCLDGWVGSLGPARFVTWSQAVFQVENLWRLEPKKVTEMDSYYMNIELYILYIIYHIWWVYYVHFVCILRYRYMAHNSIGISTNVKCDTLVCTDIYPAREEHSGPLAQVLVFRKTTAPSSRNPGRIVLFSFCTPCWALSAFVTQQLEILAMFSNDHMCIYVWWHNFPCIVSI